MTRIAKIALAISLSVLGAAQAATAATRVERDAPTLTRDAAAGGYWVEYTEYTFQSVFDGLLDEFFAKPVAGKAGSTSFGGSTTIRNDGWWGDFAGRKINFEAVDAILTTAGLNKNGWTSKKQWLSTYGNWNGKPIDDSNDAIGEIAVIPNTTSCFLELTRLAQIHQQLSAGNEAPVSEIKGYYLAYDKSNSYTIAANKDAVLAKIKEIYDAATKTWSPIVLDLNGDGRIGVTGKSSAHIRKAGNDFVAENSVEFDLRGSGKRERYEWLNGDGDGFLVDDTQGAVTAAVARGGEIDGRQLFGNVHGFDHGFQKLALRTSGIHVAASQLGGVSAAQFSRAATRQAATGADLTRLKVWIDSNRDAYVQQGELKTCAELGITEVGLRPRFVNNAQGEQLIVSYFVQNGERRMSEDVWFASPDRQ
jgi:hypothetical protein